MLRAIIGIILIAYGSAFGVSRDARAQVSPPIEWEKCFGGSQNDQANCMVKTSDGGFAFAGWTTSNDSGISGNHGGGDAWVVKLNSSGAVQWQKCLGGTSSDIANSIIQTADGGFAIAGETSSLNGDVSGYHGGSWDAWVVKLDSVGSIQWQRCLGGSAFDGAWSIAQTSDIGYVVAGQTYSGDGDVSGNHGDYDAWIVKLNDTGAIQWQKCLGGTQSDAAQSIIQTSDGGLAIAGFTYSNDGYVSGNHGGGDGWIVKLNDTGAIQWQKCIGGSQYDYAYSIVQTSDGGYAVAGETQSNDGDVSGNHGDGDVWIVKLNGIGSIEWQKCLGGTGTDIAHSIIQTYDGGFAFAGITSSVDDDVSGHHVGNDEWVVKLNDTGKIQWQKCLGGSEDDEACSIKQTSDSGLAIAGFTNSNDGNVSGNHGANDAWIVKLAPLGVPPAVSYITPDAGAPGMCVAVEIVAPVGSTGDFGTDQLYSTDSLVSLVNTSDSAFVRLGPSVVSWNGRMIQQMFLIKPQSGSVHHEVYFQITNQGVSTVDSFFVISPTNILPLSGGGTLPTTGVTSHNTMVVDSLILENGTYTCPPNGLPLRILSLGPIRLIKASLSADGSAGVTGTGGGAGGPGGGGGGGGYPGAGGNGFTGGGGDKDASASGGSGSGSASTSSTGGSSLNGVTGGSGEVHSGFSGDDGGGGGTGFPFGTSAVNGNASSSPAGGYGAGSAGGSTSSYTTNYGGGGGGFAVAGNPGQGTGNNGGQAYGNAMLIPLTGGSGGGAGNCTHITTEEGGSGGGGGGAIDLTSFTGMFFSSNSSVSANGGNGSNGKGGIESGAGGGAGSPGAIMLSARDSIWADPNGNSLFVAPSSGGTGSSSNSNGGSSVYAGRVRLNGQETDYANDVEIYTNNIQAGPSIQSVTFTAGSAVITGFGEYWSQIPPVPQPLDIYYSWPSNPQWQLTTATPVAINGSVTTRWIVSVPLSKMIMDTELYIVAVQNENPVSGGETDVPASFMSHTSGIIVKVPAGPPKALVNTNKINFGNITVGQCSDDTTFEVYSVGGSDLNITSLTLTGAGASQYFIKTQPPLDVKRGDSVAIKIAFCPMVKACPISATLTINNNDTIKIVQLTGCGIQPEAAIHPLVIDFGSVHVGDCKDSSFTLVNPGTDALTVTSEDLVDGTDFTIENATPFTLAADDSIQLHIKFCPQDTSIVSTVDSVISNAPQSPILVTLIGGGKIGILSVPNFFDFGDVHLGGCVDSGFYIYNIGNDTLHVTGATLAAGTFTLLLSPFAPIEPHDSVFVKVRFCSQDTGAFSTTLQLGSSTSAQLQVELLAHTGFGILSIPNIIDFGSVGTGGCADSNVTISNIGTDTLVIDTSNTFTAPFYFVGQNPIRLAPGENTKVDLRFCPQDTNAVSEVASFDTVGPGTSPKFTLLGNGVQGALGTSGPIALGCIPLGTSVTQSMSVKNTGTAALTNFSVSIQPMGSITIVHTPPNTLAPGATDSVVMIVVGSSVGKVFANIFFTWAGGGPITLWITAQVSELPKITSLDTVIAFDTTGVGDSSITECVGITNYSCIALPIDSVTISSGISGEFEIVSNNASRSLVDSEVGTICIRYKPLRGGQSVGQLLVKSGSDTVQIAALTGNGIGTSVGVRLAIDTIAGRPGDIVDLPVRTLNDVTSAAITSLTFRVTFDPMQLDLKAPVSPSIANPGSNVPNSEQSPLSVPPYATYSVKKYSIGDQEITATYSSPLTGMPIVAELPFEILLPDANTANVHLMSASFGTSLATLASTNDGLIEIEQCDTNERIAIEVTPVDVAPINPNPFNSRANIALTVNTAGHVRMEVFNALGELMMTPFDADVSPALLAIDIDASGLSSGSYRCVTTWSGAGNVVRDEKTMVVMR